MRYTRTPAQPDPGPPGRPFAGLCFAIYGRKSTLDARHEDHKSVTRQVEQATRYVEARGGEALPGHVYLDDEVSGAEFRARAGLLRFLDTLKNGRAFNAVVTSEESRFGREQLETGYLLKQITDAGVRVFYYLEDREARLDSALDKIMASLTLFGAELEREKARQRARDAAERKARQGLVTGGEPYGYQNVPYRAGQEVPPGEPHDCVKRRIQPAEAAIVRGIFRMYAAGWGITKIAKTLNGVPTYAAQSAEFFTGQRVAAPRTGSWAPTAIRAMLHSPLYRGELVWGRTTHTDRDGRARLTARRPAREWLRQPAPDLQIIPDELWAAVQAQLTRQAEKFAQPGAGRVAAPDLRREGRYLLSGLAQCGVCGGTFAVAGGKYRRYGCAHALKRGVCDNRLSQRVELVEESFLATLEREALLTPARFLRAVEYGVARVQEELAAQPDRRPALEEERATLTRQIAHLVAAIGNGHGPAALVAEIEKAETRLRDIEGELARLTVPPALGVLDLKRIERDVARELGRFAALLRGDVPQARQALKRLLADRVTFDPVELGDGTWTYEFRGELTYGAVLQEVVSMEKIPLGTPFIYT